MNLEPDAGGPPGHGYGGRHVHLINVFMKLRFTKVQLTLPLRYPQRYSSVKYEMISQ